MRFLAVLVLLGAVWFPAAALGSPELTAPELAPRTDPGEALAVLHAWDARRARAWADRDRLELRSLYVPGSSAGRADLRLLRAYATRGLVVRRIVTQVFAIRVLHRDPTRLRLSVFDRVAGGELVRAGHVSALHSSRPVRRTVEFRRISGVWCAAAVSGSG